MRKIMLVGFSTLVVVCGAFGADARSSDEEDSPQAATQSDYAPPLRRSPSGANLRVGRKSPAVSHDPAVFRRQGDMYDGG